MTLDNKIRQISLNDKNKFGYLIATEGNRFLIFYSLQNYVRKTIQPCVEFLTEVEYIDFISKNKKIFTM